MCKDVYCKVAVQDSGSPEHEFDMFTSPSVKLQFSLGSVGVHTFHQPTWCSFHKELIIGEKMSLGFGKEMNSSLDSLWIVVREIYTSIYGENFILNNLLSLWNHFLLNLHYFWQRRVTSLLNSSFMYIKEIGGQCPKHRSHVIEGERRGKIHLQCKIL